MTGWPTGEVTLLFTDIEGSTKRWEKLPGAMAAALARHDDLLRWAIEANGGHVFKTIGDAFCAAFADPGQAVRACLAGQRALAAAEWGEVGAVRVRMALHTGQPEQREADYFGPPVNRVARLLAAGHGGQVLLSAATAARLGSSLPAETGLVDLGSHRLKDLLQPERIFQLVGPDLEREFPPLNSLDRQPHNLPAQPTALVGREREVAAARALIEGEGARLLTLTGPGGVGKTRLALQAAAELVDVFADGAWFVPLAPVADPDLVVPAIAQALGVRETGHEPLLETVVDYARHKRFLLVVDNFEHVAAAAPIVGRLLADCRGIAIVVTSRAALRVYGEREYPVGPLALPDPKRLPPLAELAEVEAVELFVERAQAIKPGFDLDEGNAAAVAALCVRLEGLPLAIELAAARVRILPPDQLLARLTSRLALLTGGGADRDPRQQTLRGAIAWSHDLLSPPEQALFRRLAVFAGGCTAAAAEAVGRGGAPEGAGGRDDGTLMTSSPDLALLDLLDSLVQKSLLRHEEGAGEARFGMLESIREFGLERLAASGEEGAVRGAHAAHYLALAVAAEPELTGPRQGAWLDRLEAEHDNLRAALRWLGDTGGAEEELLLAGALWRFWWVRGHLTEGRGWLERVAERSAGGEPRALSKVLLGAGVLASTQGDQGRAIELHERALTLARSAGDAEGMARALENLGIAADERGETDRATGLFEEALAIDRARGHERGIAALSHHLCSVALARGSYDQAEAHAQTSVEMWRKLGDAHGAGFALLNLGILAYVREDFDRAASLYEESLDRFRELGDPHAVATALLNLGSALERRGDIERSLALYGEALTAFQELGDVGSEAFARYSLGRALRSQGNLAGAQRFLTEGLRLAHGGGDRRTVALCLEALAGLDLDRRPGDPFRAALLLGAAEALREAIGEPIPSPHQAEYERDRAVLRAALDSSSHDAAWSVGRVMAPEQVLAELAAV